MIEDSLKNRAHVVDYDQEIIPSREEIDEILRTGYSLVTSKQKAYPYKAYVLGPNKERSKKVWMLAEGDKIRIDEEALGDAGELYRPNEGLMHMISAPWTLIFTPRVAPPNAFHRKGFDGSNSYWQLEDPVFVGRENRESTAIEVGMLAKTITGAALDRGWDSSYNICFPKDRTAWKDIVELNYFPFLVQTIGKGVKYKWQCLTEEDWTMDLDPPFEDIFDFIDER